MIILNKRALKSLKEGILNGIIYDNNNLKEYFKEGKGKLERIIPKSNFEDFVIDYKGKTIFFKKLPTETKKIFYMFSVLDTTILSMTILENYIYYVNAFTEHLKKKYNNFTINIDVPEFNFKLKAKINNIQYNADTNSIILLFENEEITNTNIIKNIKKLNIFSIDFIPNTQPIFLKSSLFRYSSDENSSNSFELYIEKEKLSEKKDSYSVFLKEDFKTIEEVINNIPYLLKNNIISYFKIYSIINNNGLLFDQTLEITFPKFEFDKKKDKIYIEYKYYFIDLPLTFMPSLYINITFDFPNKVKVFKENSEEQYELLYTDDISNDLKKLFNHFSDIRFNPSEYYSRSLNIALTIEGDKFLENPSLYIYTKEKMKETIKNVFYLIFEKNKII